MSERASSLSRRDVVIGARFIAGLPGLLRHPIDAAGARAVLRARFARREADFLATVDRLVYGSVESPFRRLLTAAGCGRADLEELVTQDGVEGALRVLLRHGVYLSADEFKGRRRMMRDGVSALIEPHRLENVHLAAGLPVRTSGGAGASTPLVIGLDFMRDALVDHRLDLEARGAMGWRHAVWGMPGGAAIYHVLRHVGAGARLDRLFSQIDASAGGLHPRYRWSERLMRWTSVAAGRALPRPEVVPVADPTPIVRWAVTTLRAGATPHLQTFASLAVRFAQAARAEGVELHGMEVTMSGEPVTEARFAEVTRTGAHAMPLYGAMEGGGTLGVGCLAAAAVDEVHLFDDLRVVIQAGPEGAAHGLPPDALLVSSLRPSAPYALLNVSLGDQGVLGRRACGCPLEALGWSTHLHDLRSFEKLTVGGMALADGALGRVLEQELPARFGGGPTDYQLVEDEREDGRARLRLLVHPRIGAVDSRAVVAAFLGAIGRGSGAERMTGLVWGDHGVVVMERRAPLETPGGKILHLHRRSSPAGASGARPSVPQSLA
jgi:hypothetical protein